MSASADDRSEQQIFALSEALQAALEAGTDHADSVWALRFEVDEKQVAQVRRALEFLFEGHDAPLICDDLPLPVLPEDYEIQGELGRGGMGVVYRVRQKSLERDLALKVLRPGEMIARRAVERFKREARSLARLRHPHIASLHEVGECEGRVYFTMDLIEGCSLAERIEQGGVTPSQATGWMRQVASALQYVHSHGLVHRDIKPANILIDGNDDACVVDFGLARDVDVSSDLTISGHFLGTPAYMSPEQARGEYAQVGEASDIYGVGAVLYECLTAKPAFEGERGRHHAESLVQSDPGQGLVAQVAGAGFQIGASRIEGQAPHFARHPPGAAQLTAELLVSLGLGPPQAVVDVHGEERRGGVRAPQPVEQVDGVRTPREGEDAAA